MNNKHEFVVLFLNGISALQISTNGYIPVSNSPTLTSWEAKCSHTMLFEVLLGKIEGCHFLYFATRSLARHNVGSHISKFQFWFMQYMQYNIAMH